MAKSKPMKKDIPTKGDLPDPFMSKFGSGKMATLAKKAKKK